MDLIRFGQIYMWCWAEAKVTVNPCKQQFKRYQADVSFAYPPSSVSNSSNYSPIHGDEGMWTDVHSCLNTWANLHSCAFPPDHYIYDLYKEWLLNLRPCKSTSCGLKPRNHHLKQSQGYMIYFGLGLTCNLFLGSGVSQWQYVCEFTMYVLSVSFLADGQACCPIYVIVCFCIATVTA